MTDKKNDLLAELRQVRQLLDDLPESDVEKALKEVLSCYVPYFTPGDLNSILVESQQLVDTA